MRAPSQLSKESAPAYTVRMPFTVDRRYHVGEILDGDLCRSWPTFRTLVDLPWLLPTTAILNDPDPKPTRVKIRK